MFSFRNSLTIDHTLVGGSDLTDFPVLVSLTHVDFESVANDGDVQSANGFDIVFYADTSQSVKLDHEIEKYDPVNGVIVMWVRLPSVSSTVDTVFYVFYGDASITTSQENVAGVWDANDKGVWHLKEDPAGSAPQMLDSSGNANHLTANSGPTQDTTSQINGGLSFDGTASVSKTQNASLNGHSLITIEAWINPTTFGGNGQGRIVDKTQSGATGFFFSVNINANQLRFSRPGSNGTWDSANSSIATGAWQHVAVTYDYSSTANDPIFYVNGAVSAAQEAVAPSSTTPNDSANDFYIGDNNTGVRGFDGDIDEVRFANAIRSPGWILASYNNQFAPATFVSLGTQTAVEVATVGPSLFRGRNFPFFDDDQVNRFEFWPAVAAGATNLTIQNSSHAHSAANVVLTQTHSLAIQNATHSHTAENLSFGLAISNISTSPALAACAHIRWTTSTPATQRVFYDTVSHPSDTDGSQYAFSTPSDTLADTSYQFRLLHYLTPNTTYFYKLRSSNATDTVFSAEGSFTTAANGVRTSSLLIIRVNFPDDLASLASDATINSQMTEVADRMEEYSFGQSEVTWTIVPGTLTAPHDTDFYKALESTSNARRAEQLAIDVSALAAGAGFNTADYFQYVIWIPQLYDWANGGFFTGVNGRSQMHLNIFSADYLVMANLTLVGLGADGRANAWLSNDSTVFGSAGAPHVSGIADPYDVLGTEGFANFNLKHKTGLGWLLAPNIPTIEFNGVYRIYAHDTETTRDPDRIYGIRMPGNLGTEYWIEFRQSPASPSVAGVLINWGGLMLLDMTPGDSDFLDASLTSGNTFTDPDGRAITFTSQGGTTPAFVDVTIAGLADAPELTIQNAAHSHSADNLTLTQVHTLAIQNASHGHTSENVALTQAHALVVQGSSHAHTSENLTLVQAHSLAINDAIHAHTADNTVLAQVHQLAVNSASHGHSADSLALSQVHALIVNPATHDHNSENVVLGVAGDLQIANASHSHAVESLVLTQIHALEVANSSHSHTAQNLELTGTGDLVVQSATHEHSAQSLVLTQVHELAVANSSHDNVVGSLALTQEHSLAVQDASHEHVVESLALTQTHQLVIADAAHGHGADSQAVTQVHALAIESGSHPHTAESLTLTQAHDLTIQPSTHNHLAENVELGAPDTLAIQSATHGHASQSLTLTQVHNIAVSDSLHTHTAENLSIGVTHNLEIQAGDHSHTAENLGLGQTHTLVVAGATHGHTAENVSFGVVYNLNILSALHSHAAEHLELTQVHNLVVSDSVHEHVAQNIGLGNGNNLLIDNATHGHTAHNINFNWTIPTDIFEMPAESQVFVVPAENRIFEV